MSQGLSSDKPYRLYTSLNFPCLIQYHLDKMAMAVAGAPW